MRTLLTYGVPIAAVFVLIVTGGIIVYERAFLTPERVISGMSRELAEINSYHFDFSLSHSSGERGEITLEELFTLTSFGVHIEGDTDYSDPDTISGRSMLELTYAGIRLGPLETITYGSDLYVKLEEIPFFLNEIGGLELDKVENQWILINPESIQNYFGLSYSLPKQDYTYGTNMLLLMEEYDDLFSENFKREDTLMGKEVYVYGLPLDTEELLQNLMESQLIQEYNADGLNEADIRRMLGTIADRYETLEVEVWVGKRDFLPYRIAMFLKEENSSSSTVSMRIDFSEFNSITPIITPDQYLMFDQAIELLGYDQYARDKIRVGDLQSLQIALATYENNEGVFPIPLTSEKRCIGSGAACIDLSFLIPEYLVEIPRDPRRGTDDNTGYGIYRNEDGEVVLIAEDLK